MRKAPKDIAASVRARLLRLATSTNIHVVIAARRA